MQTQGYYRGPSTGLKLVVSREWHGPQLGGWKKIPDVRMKGRPSNVQLAERWLDDLSKAYKFSGAYVTGCKYTIARYLVFLADRKLHVSKTGKRDVLEYVKVLRSDPKVKALATLRRHLNILVSFYRDLGEDETSWVDEFAWARIASIRRKQREDYENGHAPIQRRALDEDELRKLIEGTHSLRDKAMLALLGCTGIRCGELVALKAGDIHFDELGAWIDIAPHAKRNPNNGDLMKGFVSKEIADLLRAYLERGQPNGILFPSYSGKRMTLNDVNRRVRLWAARAGLNGNGEPDLTTHGLRHTFTTLLRNNGSGEDRDWIIKRLRGDSGTVAAGLEMVDRYSHISEKELRRAYLEWWPQIGITPYV